MSVLDAFNTDAFSVVSLTQAINLLPHKPMRIEQMGIFEEEGVETTSIMVEERAGTLGLVPTARRGAGAGTETGDKRAAKNAKRTARSIAVPHIPIIDSVLADSIQNIRAFGSETQLEILSEKVNEKLGQMRLSLEVTKEYHRIGAIHGKVLDADGSTTVVNLFTEFGVSEQSQDFAFTTSTTDIRGLCLDVQGLVETAVGGLPYDHVHAFCGSEWFNALISHATVKTAYERWMDGAMLRNDPRSGFEFGGIIFERYRGTVGGVDFVNSKQARVFPVGAQGLFKCYHAPADYVETVNTIGQPYYSKQELMPLGKGVLLEAQTNPLNICTRPRCLVKLTQS